MGRGSWSAADVLSLTPSTSAPALAANERRHPTGAAEWIEHVIATPEWSPRRTVWGRSPQELS